MRIILKTIFLFVVICSSCDNPTRLQKQGTLIFSEGPVVIKGHIENAVSNTILLTTLELVGRVDHAANIDSMGNFTFSIDVLSSHDNLIIYGGDKVSIFLEPNDSLYLTADGSSFENTIKYSGDNSKFNQCLRIFFIEFVNALISEDFLTRKNTFEPNEFKKYATDFFYRMDLKADSINEIMLPQDNSNFWIKTYNKYRLAEELLEYGMHYEKTLPTDFYNFEDKFLEESDYNLLCSQYYEDFIEKYYIGYKLTTMDGFENFSNQFQEQTYNGLNTIIDFLDKNLLNRTVKNLLLTSFTHSFIEEDYKIGELIFGKFSKIVDDITCQNFILQQIDNRKSKPVSVRTINDLVNLKSVGGIFEEIQKQCSQKVLYIDIWGTWCGACLNAFPYSNKLHKELHDNDVEFVYLCVKSNKDEWQKVISNYNLNGKHFLLTDDQFGILAKNFNCYGVPRYIIIDKKGIIVDEVAKNPRSTELKNELLTLTND